MGGRETGGEWEEGGWGHSGGSPPAFTGGGGGRGVGAVGRGKPSHLNTNIEIGAHFSYFNYLVAPRIEVIQIGPNSIT